MRLIVICALALLTSGCAALDAIRDVHKRDDVLMMALATIFQDADDLHAVCGTAGEVHATQVLVHEVAWTQVYTTMGYEEDAAALRALGKIVAQLDPGVGKTYCQETARDIQNEVVRIGKTVGGRPR